MRPNLPRTRQLGYPASPGHERFSTKPSSLLVRGSLSKKWLICELELASEGSSDIDSCEVGLQDPCRQCGVLFKLSNLLVNPW